VSAAMKDVTKPSTYARRWSKGDETIHGRGLRPLSFAPEKLPV